MIPLTRKYLESRVRLFCVTDTKDLMNDFSGLVVRPASLEGHFYPRRVQINNVGGLYD